MKDKKEDGGELVEEGVRDGQYRGLLHFTPQGEATKTNNNGVDKVKIFTLSFSS